MSAIRPNPQPSDLTLDEQSFESLLSAAFTIQEHNKRRKDANLQQGNPSLELVADNPAAELTTPQEDGPKESGHAVPETTPLSICPHCGSPKSEGSANCNRCGLGEFRPGERLQRNWASMWLKSQAQGLWPDRSALPDETVRKIGEAAHHEPPPVSQSIPDLRTEETLASPVVFPLVKDEEINDPNSFEKSPPTAEDTCAIEVHPFALPASDVEVPEETAVDRVSVPAPLWQRLADAKVRLRFHRADLYLCVAVVLALFALLWPASASPKRGLLTPWQRALVTLGIAEAPAPVIHLQGDPAVEVWVDPHTALYYCPGAEPYGKTVDGRLTSQHEAQLDRFEPAGRSVCE